MIYKIKNLKISGLLSSEAVDYSRLMRHAKTATASIRIC